MTLPMNESSPRIAFFMPSLRGGGVERTFVNLSNALVRMGESVDLVVGASKGPNRNFISPDVRLFDLTRPRMSTALPALARYLRDRKPLCLVSGMEHTNAVAVLAKRISRSKTTVVASIHNTLSVQYAVQNSCKMRLTLEVAKRIYPMADKVIAVSRESADDAARVLGMARDRIGVIYNPTVTPDLFAKAAEVPDHPWLVNHDEPVILGVGRLSEQKDFATLIRAFAKVRQQRSSRLIILGEGPLRQSLEQLVRSLGLEDSVALPGFAMNPYAYLSHANVYVLSSLFEGLPGTLIEALACGAPIVSTDCKSGPKEILDEGRWGRIVPVGDTDSMAGAIIESIDSGRIARPESCYAPFTIEAVTHQYLALAREGSDALQS